jgi:cytoplasmic iron level regulating protein YaaA (DUF328/UPF0246 family)
VVKAYGAIGHNEYVLILLPPSEGKTRPAEGPALDLASLSLPDLNPTRQRVLESLLKLCTTDTTRARTILGLTPGMDEELASNAAVLSSPTAPAINIFTGVLFSNLNASALPVAAQRWLNVTALIGSGLFGVIAPNDPIPVYRLSGDATLPQVGSLPGLWRPALAEVLPERAATGVILDCRSQQYAAMWQPTEKLRDHTVVLRVLQRTIIDGEERLRIVSHHNKATKGLFVRELAKAQAKPRNVNALVDIVHDLGFSAKVEPTPYGGWQLDLITDPVTAAVESDLQAG